MENFYTKLKNKRMEELELEKKTLSQLVNKYESQKSKNEKEIINLKNQFDLITNKDSSNKFDDNILKNKLENNNKKINQIKEDISSNVKSIDALKETFDKENKKIIKKENDFKNEIFNLQSEGKVKETNIKKYQEKKNNLKIVLDNLENNLKGVKSEILSVKNNIKDKYYSNVIERHILIQENLNNLILKKKIQKEKKELEETLKKERINLIEFEGNRKEEREQIKQDYFKKINDNNIIDEMDKLEIDLENFDKDTKKLYFFMENKVKNLEKKIKTGNEIYALKQADRLFEKQRISNENSIIIEKLNIKKRNILNEIKEFTNDYNFIDDSIKIQVEKLENFIKNVETLKKQYAEEITENKKQNQDLFILNFNEKTKENENLEKKVLEIEKNIELEKKKYYDSKRKFEVIKNNDKISLKNIKNSIENLESIIQREENEFMKDEKRIKQRIKYLQIRIDNENLD